MSETDAPVITTEAPEKKKRTPRPLWVLIPVTGTQTFEVHRCPGQPAVRKLLEAMEIDATDPRIGGIKVLRAEEVPFSGKAQIVFKFGKAAEGEDVDDEEI